MPIPDWFWWELAANLSIVAAQVWAIALALLLWRLGWKKKNGWHPPEEPPPEMPPPVGRQKKPIKRKRPGR